jgi:alpha-D-ribose 1-methylphosphonate 5-triphosphate diphosphatase PhnM
LASILQANYDSLVRQNMVKEGNTREAAESQVDLLITLARFAKRLDLRIASHDKVTEAHLKLELNLD